MKIFLACACLVAMSAMAGDAWMARIRADHPRMFFNAETWPQARARAEGPAKP
ncbi:MAG: hypothetical protein IJ658_12205 [Kiritimatiellae bacterium]|nr:hypothetical protein [Kiritimatiellia bacterium]